MKKSIFVFFALILFSNVLANEVDYKNLTKIEMDVLRNGEKIGFSNYYFKHDGSNMEVKNNTEFEVKLLGIKVLSIKSTSVEKYKNEKLVFFKSNTIQNDKKKYVNLRLDENLNKFIIDGSSFKGEANINNVIGNWWNSKILTVDTQISPLSGSIKEQTVKLIKKENIEIDGKNYETIKFKIKSKDDDLPEDKKLNFKLWLDPREGLIIKVSYKRLGKWCWLWISM